MTTQIIVKDARKRGWFWTQNEIFDTWGQYLKPNGLAVYLCLCRHVNNNAECWPSFKRVAQKCGMHRTTVIKNIKLLESYQLIRSESRLSDHGDPDTNVYFNRCASPAQRILRFLRFLNVGCVEERSASFRDCGNQRLDRKGNGGLTRASKMRKSSMNS